MFASLIIKTKLGVLTELSDSDTAIERSSCKLNTERIHLTCFKTQHHSWIKREYRHSIAQSLLKNYLCKVQLISYNIAGRYKTSRLLDTFHNRTITSTRNMPKRKAYTVRAKLDDYLENDQTLASFVDTWADIDNNIDTDQQLTDDQILDEAKATVAVNDDAIAPDVADDVPVLRPTAAEAVAGLQTALSWIEGEDANYLMVMQLGNLLRIAKTARLASRRQKKVTDYFTTNSE